MVIDTVKDEIWEEEAIGSFNHGYTQLRLGGLLDRFGKFTPVGELSLDVSGIDLGVIQMS